MAKLKKLVWFHPALITSGGGERLILEGVKNLERLGIEIYLLVFNFSNERLFNGSYNPKMVRLVHEDKETFISSFSRIKRYLTQIISLDSSELMHLVLLRKAIKEINPDVIISQGQWGMNIPVYLAAWRTSIPHVVHIFGSVFPFPEEFSKYALVFRKHFNEIRRSLERYEEIIPPISIKIPLVRRIRFEINALLKYLSVRKAKVIFVLSNRNKWEIKKLYGKDAVVNRGAFPAKIFNYDIKENIKDNLNLKDKKVILYIGRLAHQKRVDICIQAFGEISKTLENINLIIGGVGPEEEALRNLAKKLGLESNIKFVGYLKEKELWDYYACSDVFVSLDQQDFDITIYEALALGSKVVCASEMEIDKDLEGNRFIFQTKTTVGDAAEAIQKALTSELTSMSAKEKMNLSKYTWENYIRRMVEEIEEALG